MMSRLQQLVSRHSSQGVLIDSVLLYLVFLGRANRKHVGRSKRTTEYTPGDFDAVSLLISSFQKIVVTPHFLTEISNLANELSGHLRGEFFAGVTSALNNERLVECDAPTRSICDLDPHIVARFGITDSMTIVAATQCSYLVLTDDTKLIAELASRSIDVLDLKTVRDA